MNIDVIVMLGCEIGVIMRLYNIWSNKDGKQLWLNHVPTYKKSGFLSIGFKVFDKNTSKSL